MQPITDKKIVIITRRTRLAELVSRYNTVSQAKFYIEHLGADFSDYLHEDEQYHHSVTKAGELLARFGRIQVVDRGFLPNFLFGQDDLIVVIGQDGLVANTVKYLSGQLLVGVNPDPHRWEGKLLPFQVSDLKQIIPEVIKGGRPTQSVTMAKASLNNGQVLYAVNDIFLGPKSHTSARYTISLGSSSEQQSSSGIIISTGLGSTGWFKSLVTGAIGIVKTVNQQGIRTPRKSNRSSQKLNSQDTPTEFPWDADYLYFTVREPFPSKTSSSTIVFGQLTDKQPLTVISQMAEHGIIFSDGIEKDFLEFNSGTRALISLADKKGNLVI
jgi:NAD kinase